MHDTISFLQIKFVLISQYTNSFRSSLYRCDNNIALHVVVLIFTCDVKNVLFIEEEKEKKKFLTVCVTL